MDNIILVSFISGCIVLVCAFIALGVGIPLARKKQKEIKRLQKLVDEEKNQAEQLTIAMENNQEENSEANDVGNGTNVPLSLESGQGLAPKNAPNQIPQPQTPRFPQQQIGSFNPYLNNQQRQMWPQPPYQRQWPQQRQMWPQQNGYGSMNQQGRGYYPRAQRPQPGNYRQPPNGFGNNYPR